MTRLSMLDQWVGLSSISCTSSLLLLFCILTNCVLKCKGKMVIYSRSNTFRIGFFILNKKSSVLMFVSFWINRRNGTDTYRRVNWSFSLVQERSVGLEKMHTYPLSDQWHHHGNVCKRIICCNRKQEVCSCACNVCIQTLICQSHDKMDICRELFPH